MKEKIKIKNTRGDLVEIEVKFPIRYQICGNNYNTYIQINSVDNGFELDILKSQNKVYGIKLKKINFDRAHDILLNPNSEKNYYISKKEFEFKIGELRDFLENINV